MAPVHASLCSGHLSESKTAAFGAQASLWVPHHPRAGDALSLLVVEWTSSCFAPLMSDTSTGSLGG